MSLSVCWVLSERTAGGKRLKNLRQPPFPAFLGARKSHDFRIAGCVIILIFIFWGTSSRCVFVHLTFCHLTSFSGHFLGRQNRGVHNRGKKKTLRMTSPSNFCFFSSNPPLSMWSDRTLERVRCTGFIRNYLRGLISWSIHLNFEKTCIYICVYI